VVLGAECKNVERWCVIKSDHPKSLASPTNNYYCSCTFCRSVIMAISADLGSRLENIVNQLVSTGRYNSKSEVLREGVRLVEEREKRLAALDAAIAEGIADADAGRVMPGDEVLDKLEAKYKAMAEKNK
jgi:antitoxin ParD1/3/4